MNRRCELAVWTDGVNRGVPSLLPGEFTQDRAEGQGAQREAEPQPTAHLLSLPLAAGWVRTLLNPLFAPSAPSQAPTARWTATSTAAPSRSIAATRISRAKSHARLAPHRDAAASSYLCIVGVVTQCRPTVVTQCRYAGRQAARARHDALPLWRRVRRRMGGRAEGGDRHMCGDRRSNMGPSPAAALPCPARWVGRPA